VVFQISTEKVSVARRRGRPEVTSLLDSSSLLCINGLLTVFVYLFPFKSYSNYSFWLEIATGAEILGFWVDSRHLNACSQQRIFEKAHSCVKPRRLSRHACLCDGRFDQYAIARKVCKTNQKKKITKLLYFTYAGERPYPSNCSGS
jgi:hypothetical protein